jgi:hypothetical protein
LQTFNVHPNFVSGTVLICRARTDLKKKHFFKQKMGTPHHTHTHTHTHTTHRRTQTRLL